MNTSHNFDYLKNVVLGYIESGNDEKMLPVVAELLQFSPAELKRCDRRTHLSNTVARFDIRSEAVESHIMSHNAWCWQGKNESKVLVFVLTPSY